MRLVSLKIFSAHILASPSTDSKGAPSIDSPFVPSIALSRKTDLPLLSKTCITSDLTVGLTSNQWHWKSNSKLYLVSKDELNRTEGRSSSISKHRTYEKNQFGIYQIDDDVVSDLEKYVDFVDIPTLKDRYPNPDTGSFTRNYDATVGSCRGRAKFRLNQAFTGNRKMATDLNGNINIIYSELMRKFDALSEYIKRLDSQVAENATATKTETERLPGRTDTNLKRHVNDVLLRSGKRLIPSTIEINYAGKPSEFEKTGESRSRPILPDNPDPGSEHSREKERSNTGKSEKATINLDEEEEESEEDVEIDLQEGNNVD
ncbi:hypothetical protein F2Q68_00021148 [Brassica cretica]|uniref:Uncharacterized protein n=1 Tax=Brassica cretica TaxID=69181 RepID=A0A8S9G010_BRACR|nr:hypothetical protein F2Q68_00021148 [Brassica cretica]